MGISFPYQKLERHFPFRSFQKKNIPHKRQQKQLYYFKVAGRDMRHHSNWRQDMSLYPKLSSSSHFLFEWRQNWLKNITGQNVFFSHLQLKCDLHLVETVELRISTLHRSKRCHLYLWWVQTYYFIRKSEVWKYLRGIIYSCYRSFSKQ